jgi:hypothetical protein
LRNRWKFSHFVFVLLLVQGRLLGASVDVSIGDLAALKLPAFTAGASALTITIPREVADDQLRVMTNEKLAATLEKHVEASGTHLSDLKPWGFRRGGCVGSILV